MKTISNEQTLPQGIKASGLKYARYEETEGLSHDEREFELWFTPAFGWCIPTLLISSGRSRGTTDRAYATTLDGKTVRIGKGPHVKRCVTVYARNSRMADLKKYFDMKNEGAARSGAIRDRISTRRAVGQEMRAAGRTSWTW